MGPERLPRQAESLDPTVSEAVCICLVRDVSLGTFPASVLNQAHIYKTVVARVPGKGTSKAPTLKGLCALQLADDGCQLFWRGAVAIAWTADYGA